MPLKKYLVPLVIFCILSLSFGLIDLLFIETSAIYKDFVWRYPQTHLYPLSFIHALAAISFGQKLAALLIPVLLLTLLKQYKRVILPWVLVAILSAIQLLWGFSLLTGGSYYSSFEPTWRALHIPMSSNLTMTLTDSSGYIAIFFFMQFVIALTLSLGYGIAYLRGKASSRPSET